MAANVEPMTRDVSDVWRTVTSAQAAPPAATVVGCVLVAAIAVLWRPAWRRSRHIVTIVHEGAHGVAALASGRRLQGIRLHSDTSGLTLSRGRTRGPGMIATAFAGYVGPAALGLAAAVVLYTGHAVALLWSLLLALTLLLVQIRNFFGLWSVLVAGAAVFAVSWWATGPVQSAFAYTITCFLLLAAPRPVLELRDVRRRGARGTDADALARLTHTPAGLWVGTFLLITLGAVMIGAWLLTRAVSSG